jgi:hypothetical protein
VIPAGLEAFGFAPAPGRGLVQQERQRNTPQQGQVVGRVSRVHHQQPSILQKSPPCLERQVMRLAALWLAGGDGG